MIQRRKQPQFGRTCLFVSLVCALLITGSTATNAQRKISKPRVAKTKRNKTKELIIVTNDPEVDVAGPGLSFFDGTVFNGIYRNENLKFSFEIPENWVFFVSGQTILNDGSQKSALTLKAELNRENGLDLFVTMQYQPGQAPNAIFSIRQQNLQTDLSLAATGKKMLAESLESGDATVTKNLSAVSVDGVKGFVFEIENGVADNRFLQKTFLAPRADDNILLLTWVLKKESSPQIIEDAMKTFRLE